MKPCLTCGLPSDASRCPDHEAEYENGRESRRTDHVAFFNGGRWKRFSSRLRRLSPFCEWCGATSGLTVDHIIPFSEEPNLCYVEENCRILCRSCNSARGDRCTEAERASVRARIAVSAARKARGVSPPIEAPPTRGKAHAQLHTTQRSSQEG